MKHFVSDMAIYHKEKIHVFLDHILELVGHIVAPAPKSQKDVASTLEATTSKK